MLMMLFTERLVEAFSSTSAKLFRLPGEVASVQVWKDTYVGYTRW